MITMTAPTQKYLDFADYLGGLSLDCMEAGLEATATDFGLAAGAILTLLTDTGLIDAKTFKPV